MIKGVGPVANTECEINIGTHGGGFHPDDTAGITIYETANMKKDIFVVRTGDLKQLGGLNLVLDIGGGEFDHHMAGFNIRRKSGEKYASAGLMWRRFGEQAIKNVIAEKNINLNVAEIQQIKEKIDREVIIPVDQEDNGEKCSNHTFSFIPKFIPAWTEKPDYDQAFQRVERCVAEILKEIIKEEAIKIVTEKELEERYNKVCDGILELPVQTMPWKEAVVDYNKKRKTKINFVIFPHPTGGWALQSVPPTMKKEFEQRIPLPKEWAGKTDKALQEASGIKDAIRCHNGLFFAKAETKQSVIEMCKIATEKWKKKSILIQLKSLCQKMIKIS